MSIGIHNLRTKFYPLVLILILFVRFLFLPRGTSSPSMNCAWESTTKAPLIHDCSAWHFVLGRLGQLQDLRDISWLKVSLNTVFIFMQITKDIPGYHGGYQDHKAISRVRICTGNILNYLLCCSTVVWVLFPGETSWMPTTPPKRESTQTKVISAGKPNLVHKYILTGVINK